MRLKGDNIFWDLDGVLRNLTYKFHNGDIDNWNKVNGSGKTVMEHVEEDLSVLVDAPECEYAYIAKMFYPVHIVSAQPDHWRKHTSVWIDKYFPNAKIKYLTDTHHKLRYLEARTRILIEDCPLYDSYRDIILVDRPYNRDIVVPIRVHDPEELLTQLRRYLNAKKD